MVTLAFRGIGRVLTTGEKMQAPRHRLGSVTIACILWLSFVVAYGSSAESVTPEAREILLGMSSQDPTLLEEQLEASDDLLSALEGSELIGPSRDLEGLLPLAGKLVAAKLVTGVVKAAVKERIEEATDAPQAKIKKVLKGLSNIGPTLNTPALNWKYSATMEGKAPRRVSYFIN